MLLRALCILAAVCWLSVAAVAQQFEGLNVTAIRFPGVAAEDTQREADLISLKAAQPYSAEKVRQSIQQLYATGRYFDIQVDAHAVPGGVEVVFQTTKNYFIGGVFVDGIPVPPTVAQQIAATRLELGTEWTQEKETAARDGLKRLMEEHGWYESTVQMRVEQDDANNLVRVHFVVLAGRRARIAGVRVTGSPAFDASKVRAEAKLHTGQELNGKRIPNALTRLQKFYQRKHYLEAKIEVAERRLMPAENRVEIVLNIEAGPTVDVTVQGARLSRGKQRQIIPIFQEGTVDPDLVREGENSLRDYFERKGRFEVQVSATMERQPAQHHLVVDYKVDPGPKHEVALVKITGNHYFNTETLRERMRTAAGGLLSHGRYSRELVDHDADAIRSLYESNGFQHVNVQTEVEDNYQGKEGRIALLFRIEEGPQTLVRHFRLEGNSAVPTDELTSRVAEASGQPYSESNVLIDRDTLLSYYFNQGFRQADLTSEIQPVPGHPDQVDVTYRVVEGRRRFVNHVLISGIEKTRPDIVWRQVAMKDGQPLSQVDLLDTQRNLYDLGIFQGVDIAVENAPGRETYKNALIQLTEARRWTMQVGFGADVARFGRNAEDTSTQGQTGFSPRVSFDVTRLNFRGLNHTIALKTAMSTLEKHVLLSYEAPRVFGSQNLTLLFNGYFDQRFDVLTFQSRREEGSVALQQKSGKTDQFVYRYAYRRVTAERNTRFVSVNLVPLFSRPVRVGMLSGNWVRDRRDDPVDTHRGREWEVDTGVASRQLGSEASFSRGLIRFSSYHPVTRKWTFARSTQVGVLHPFGRPIPVIITNPDGTQTTRMTSDVPLPEKFFSGGGNSLRGFAVNQAGPRDALTGFPLGGNALFVNNSELRFPLIGANITGAVFHDMGNVYSEAGNFSLRVRQRDPTDFDYAVHAVGFGVRYRTPIGPIRFDLAYSINPPKYFGVTGSEAPSGGCVRDSSGSFPPGCSLQQLSHFQFFFSIGQSF